MGWIGLHRLLENPDGFGRLALVEIILAHIHGPLELPGLARLREIEHQNARDHNNEENRSVEEFFAHAGAQIEEVISGRLCQRHRDADSRF